MENLRKVYNSTVQPKADKERCAAAWTEHTGYAYYPQFVNFTLVNDGTCRLTVRSKERTNIVNDNAQVTQGGILTIIIPQQSAKLLLQEALNRWDWAEQMNTTKETP